MIFDFQSNYTLENEHVLLRPLVAEDAAHLLPFSLDEPTLWTYSLVTAAGKENLEAYISKALEARNEGKDYPFIVFDKRSGQYAGCTRFYDIQLSFQTAQLGYTWYGGAFQGTGLNKQCKFLLLQFAFEQWGLERVEFRADNRNERSIAAMKSIGCTVEGILRNHLPKLEGGRRDSIILSILKEEWENGVRERLLEKLISNQ
jgi:N-acetyltransferase